MEHVVLSSLPITRLTTELHSIDEVEGVVIRSNRNIITKELVNFLHNTTLISRGELLDVIRAANVREI